MKTWSCKIGEIDPAKLPKGSYNPMRKAVEAAFKELTGEEPVFVFSGWGAELTEEERAVVEDRQPDTASPFSILHILATLCDAQKRLALAIRFRDEVECEHYIDEAGKMRKTAEDAILKAIAKGAQR